MVNSALNTAHIPSGVTEYGEHHLIDTAVIHK